MERSAQAWWVVVAVMGAAVLALLLHEGAVAGVVLVLGFVLSVVARTMLRRGRDR